MNVVSLAERRTARLARTDAERAELARWEKTIADMRNRPTMGMQTAEAIARMFGDE